MQDFTPLPNWQHLDPTILFERVEQAGIAGMGGGGFSTARKLRLAHQAQVTRIIANAVECEPGITADAALLAEHSTEVAQGLRIVMAVVGAAHGVLAVAADFPAATHASIQQCLQPHSATHTDTDTSIATDSGTDTPPYIKCTAIQRTPGAGAERALCQQIFGLTLDPSQYPIEHGVLCLNVGTLFAIQQAIVLGKPLQQRLVTVNGDTHWVALGTALSDLLDVPEQEDATSAWRYRVGGHYTGKLSSPQTQVTAATNAVWLVNPAAASPCTYCSRCADACPEGLAPQVLLRLCQDPSTEAATQRHTQGLSRCTECGLCNNQCPSNIDLLSSFQLAKSEAATQQIAAAVAARAKQRHQRHLVRTQTRAQVAQQRRESRRETRRQRQGGPDAWR